MTAFRAITYAKAMDDNYSKRELDMKFESLEKKVDEGHLAIIERMNESERKNLDRAKEMFNMLEEIKGQTTKHNGRMSKQESLTRGVIMSGTVALFLGGIIVGLVVYIYQYQLEQQSVRITNLKALVQDLQEK